MTSVSHCIFRQSLGEYADIQVKNKEVIIPIKLNYVLIPFINKKNDIKHIMYLFSEHIKNEDTLYKIYYIIQLYLDYKIPKFLINFINIQMGKDTKFHMNIDLYVEVVDNGYRVYVDYILEKK